MLQRSKEWFEERRGRFTASSISKLLGVRGFGQTGEDYIFEKASEIVFGIDENEQDFVTFDMQRGINLEPLAFGKFAEIKALEFLEVGKIGFLRYGENAGASPDGLVTDGCLEIKCPRPQKFFRLVAKGYDAIDINYLDQMQFQMLCSNTDKCYFFNYIIYNGKEMYHEIIVNRDEQRINFIKQRIEEATQLRDEYVQYLIENKQF